MSAADGSRTTPWAIGAERTIPLYRCRRLLTKADERLDERGRTKLPGLLDAGDPHGEVRAAWHAKEVVRSIYDHHDPSLALRFVELGDELGRHLGVGDVVDRAEDFLGVPGHAHLAFGVARREQTKQLGLAAIIDTFMRLVGGRFAVERRPQRGNFPIPSALLMRAL